MYQTLPSSGAADWETFTIGGEVYAAVANSYPSTATSTVYWWNSTAGFFEAHGSFATTGARDLEFITVSGESYLVAANEYDYDASSFRVNLSSALCELMVEIISDHLRNRSY